MTENEILLETCIHEAAHFAFAVWAKGRIHEISIGEREIGGYISGGHVSWSMTEDLPSDKLGAVFAAGKAIDTLRARLSCDEIERGALVDKAGFKPILEENLGEIDQSQLDSHFELGLRTAIHNLKDQANLRQVECLGHALFNRCVNGKVVIPASDLQALYNECLPA